MIWDNASFHHSPLVATCLQGRPFETRYLPPYSPTLNPVELVFNTMKNKLRALRPKPTTTQELKTAAEAVLDNISQSNLGNYFHHVEPWLNRAFHGLTFD